MLRACGKLHQELALSFGAGIAEAANVEKVVTNFMKSGVQPSQIGVITPYEGQRAHILAVMLRNGPLKPALYEGVEVSSVDAFQGREKDYIILSCVRSNEHQVPFFMRSKSRMSVWHTVAQCTQYCCCRI